jgi:hypothetical protein
LFRALSLRNHDRLVNAANYPLLQYPEIYILEGGYKDFYSQFKVSSVYRHTRLISLKEWCDPCGYVEMKDDKFKSDLRAQSQNHQFNNATRKFKQSKSFMLDRRPKLEEAVGRSGLARHISFIEPTRTAALPMADISDHQEPVKPVPDDSVFRKPMLPLGRPAIKSWSRRF